MFGTVKLTKNADPDKYSFSRYGAGFDCQFEILTGGKKVVIFGLDISLSICG